MFTSTILFAALTTAAPVAAQPQARMANYTVVNQIANPGFESGMSSWSTANSFIDPDWLGDPAQYSSLWSEGTTNYTKRSGSRGFQFGLQPEYGFGEAYVFSEIHQTLSTPVNTNSLVSAQFYAWSTASSWSPQTVTVEIQYSDAAPSYYDQDITGNYYDPQLSDWKLVNFKGALKAGKTVTKITVATVRYPYQSQNLYIDDMMVGKKVPLIFSPTP